MCAVAGLGWMGAAAGAEHPPAGKEQPQAAAVGAPAVATQAASRAAPRGPGQEITLDCGAGVTMKLTLIPAGEFMMGAEQPEAQVVQSSQGEKVPVGKMAAYEQPQHKVKLTKPFYMGVYLVTQAQYQAVMGENNARFKGDNLPAETVAWNDAEEFCKKLSASTGQTIKLPTEAQWEYACRAGTTTPFYTGDTLTTDQANFNGTATYGSGVKGADRQKTTPVGSFPPNPWGLYDMAGNVMEWCQDYFDGSYYEGSPGVNPPGPAQGGSHSVRGGSWVFGPMFARSAARHGGRPEIRGYLWGFRVICVPKP